MTRAQFDRSLLGLAVLCLLLALLALAALAGAPAPDGGMLCLGSWRTPSSGSGS